MQFHKVSLILNGEETAIEVKPYETLLETLRERLSLTGAKEACGLGTCGACTVIVDGKPVRSCLVLTVELNGSSVETVEGLKKGGKLHPLQSAFIEKGAVQCGFCTSGMIMVAKALLERNPKPDRVQIVETISSNLCRCTGYKKIIEAVEEATKMTNLT
ncbi:MAG: (2Fe-2S)-binding protein [Desulfobacterota bacterium]|nr:(2Fe-2S)-binding protein [Thermodesulfobacteriota bacterium]MDW8001769.1 (2Fe-2S)-binding protein [Deltaproteobacteria bacterium]